ncbi:uncharacterized protein [Palaemon carinicauda]|uniref:uncharacterized protein n=1 Tax=Palaemon carinicauda TaxID=392227 RepID=UPI0035B59D69
MSEIVQLISLLQQQLESQSTAHRLQLETLCEAQQKQINVLAAQLTSAPSTSVSMSIPQFSTFDSASVLWKDYRERFITFVGANSIPKEKQALVLLTNQSTTNYKLLKTLEVQQTPPIEVNDLTLDDIDKFMEEHFHPRRFIVRERFKFWCDMKRKPGETIQERAARIRHDAATCDCSSIQKPQDEAMRTRFMCSINNEPVLKAIFKVPNNEKTFSKAIQIALETEEGAKVAKETIHGSKSSSDFDEREMNKVRTEIGTEVLELQKVCKDLCNEFTELFRPELGCLRDFELEIAFKRDTKPIFCKPETVPFAIVDDLNQAYEVGIKCGIWEYTQFCEYGTLVVLIRKVSLQGQKPKLHVCGDYSATVNQQLEIHRYPMPNPENLMQKLSEEFCFTKIYLADSYNQIKLGPESQRKLALSTHRGVLLQKRLPFGITSAPAYFQEIMEQLTCDLEGVAVFLDDFVVRGSNDRSMRIV